MSLHPLRLVYWVAMGCSLFFLGGCVSLDGQERSHQAQDLALVLHWQELKINTSPYDLRAYLSPQKSNDGVLTIYIEGDGSSWIHGEFPSSDPTPKDPIGLKLALAQPQGAVAYLARPCQFVGLENSRVCNFKVWTTERFSQKVIDSINPAIDLLKSRAQAQSLILVGYSGGAAVALLAASQRHDVQSIISVAGNVNPHTWAKNLALEPLDDSLDPREAIIQLISIPQIYLVGAEDRLVPLDLTTAFIEQFPKGSAIEVLEIPKNGHVCCWVEQWPLLWTRLIKPLAPIKSPMNHL